MERFSASVAGRHMTCHGSANLDAAIPGWIAPPEDPDADNAANRGTKMHAQFADIMSLSTKDAVNMGKALAYVAAVRQERRFKVLIEAEHKATWLARHPGDNVPSTTADLVLYVKDEIHIFDLKTGVIPVEVVDNEQMLYYAATYAYLAPDAKGVHLHIVQPWASNIEVWFVDTARILDFMVKARQTRDDIQAGSVKLQPSDHCKFCPANPHSRAAKGRPLCPAMMSMLYPDPTDYDAILNGD